VAWGRASEETPNERNKTRRRGAARMGEGVVKREREIDRWVAGPSTELKKTKSRKETNKRGKG